MFSSAAQEALLPDRGFESEFIVEPAIAVRELVMEGMRRLDEWRRVAEVLPSDYTIVHALGRAAGLPALDVRATHGEPVALGDLCLETGRPRFEVARPEATQDGSIYRHVLRS